MDIKDIQKEADKLIGKKIISATVKGIKKDTDDAEYYDDIPYLILKFDDDSEVTVSSYYGGYTGKSEDEYPAFIGINFLKKGE